MFDKGRQYSYKTQRRQRNMLLGFLFNFLILYITYNCITAFFLSVWVLDNNTMQPMFNKGDRLVFYSFKLPSRFLWFKSSENTLLFQRGSAVLVDMGRERSIKLPLRIIDGVVRFFTGQQVSIFSGEGQYYIKRVVGLPGDEIYMADFVFRVKPAGGLYSLTEFELSEKPYHPAIPQIPALWNESLPFSGTMDKIVLGPDECFVVSDDRGNTNDSRTWGPIPTSYITAKAVLRFWPVTKIFLP
jgi:signal peptidase I